MAFVIAAPCTDVKDTACVDACPCDCIHPRRDEGGFPATPQLYINPIECIDCGACVPAGPVSAIYLEADLPDQWRHFAQVNADWFAPKPA